ncbi:MAG: 2'-5' RNA ligase family protein [Ginsengibacter sp.]
MTNTIRRQLTLFIEDKDAGNIEKVRQKFNIRQSELIKSHVTLCRDDEIENLEQVLTNLATLQLKGISICFGQVIRFADGKGVLIPAKGENKEFQNLRKLILQGLNGNPGQHEPHVTVMHPRNSTCTDIIFEQIAKVNLPTSLDFKKISLIEQEEGRKWEIRKEFDFVKAI